MSKLRLCEPYKINQRLDRDQHLVSYTLGSLQGTTLSWQQRYTKEAGKSEQFNIYAVCNTTISFLSTYYANLSMYLTKRACLQKATSNVLQDVLKCKQQGTKSQVADR